MQQTNNIGHDHQALQGIKVLELCELVSGPYCASLLAGLGSEVVKIEKPGEGDIARKREPYLSQVPHLERSGLFHYLNLNKLGISLDFSQPDGREILLKLVEQSDVLIEDKAPGTMENLGTDYESLKVVNPRIIVTSITPFGQDGPYSNYKAYDLNICHATGEATLVGANCDDPYEYPPVKIGRFVADYEAGVGAAVATLMAVYERGISGQGQHIDFSKFEWGIGMTLRALTRYFVDGVCEDRVTANYPVFGLLPCKDGYIALQAFIHWSELVEAMGHPDWANDEKYKDPHSRAVNGKELNAQLKPWLANLTTVEAFELMYAHHVPCGIVRSPSELVESEQLSLRGFFVEVEHPEMGVVKSCSVPYRFSKAPVKQPRPAPLLGQHNEEVFCKRLGYSYEEIAKLRSYGVL